MANKKYSLSNFFDNPVIYLTAIYPYFLVLIVAVGLFYIGKTNIIQQNRIPIAIPDTSNQNRELTLAEPRITSAIDLKTISNPTPEIINKGKELYQNTCASCHGNEGNGDGVAGASLNPKPRNFHELTGWKNGRKFSDMFLTLLKGIPNSGMTAYDFMPVEDRIAILQYIRSIMTDPPAISTEEISKMDADYKLSQGTQLPGQIPISAAIKIISEEKNAGLNNAANAIAMHSNVPSPYAIELFNQVTNDKVKAIALLVNSNEWKANEAEFTKIISQNLYLNGFNGKILELSSEEVRDLYLFLKSQI